MIKCLWPGIRHKLDDTTGNYGIISVVIAWRRTDTYWAQIRVNGYYVEGGSKVKLAQRKDGLRREYTRGFTGRQGWHVDISLIHSVMSQKKKGERSGPAAA